jgi:hypothetical protein
MIAMVIPNTNTNNAITGTVTRKIFSMSVESWNSFFQWGSVVLIAVTFVLGAGALMTGNRINARQTARLVTLETDLAKQQERAAEAEAKLLAMIAPRRITASQRSQLLGALSEAVLKGPVHMLTPFGDPEALEYAEDIRAVLNEAGWPTGEVKQGLLTGFGLGITVNPAEGHPHSAALRQIFKSTGFELVDFEDARAPGIQIVVATKK